MKRISKSSKGTPASGFFAHFESEIYDALIDDGTPRLDTLAPFYVSDRPYSSAPEHLSKILNRLPTEFQEMYSAAENCGENPSVLRIGFYELDFLDFLINQKRNRVLRLVGNVGVGKTTFLQYVFRCIRPNCASMTRYFPIHLGFMGYPKSSIDDSDLAQMMLLSILEALKELQETSSGKIRSCAEKLRIVFQRFGENRARSEGMYSIIQKIKQEMVNISEIEPVFILDNVDHLDCESVEQISHLSRAIFTETRACVVIAMRPPAFATHAETDAHKGAFYTFRIILPPPDLKTVFHRRLRNVLNVGSSEFELGGTQYSFVVDDVENAVQNIVENIFVPESERLLLEGVANKNIRKAALGFQRFLSWPGLRPDLLISPEKAPARELPGGFREHLLRGMMLGRSTYFRDTPEDRPVISNVLQYNSNIYPVDVLIQYRVLALLSWARRTINSDNLVTWLEACGYERGLIKMCLEHMLRRALIYSPETEDDFEVMRNVSLSTSGSYYLVEMLLDPEYILEVIPDVELRHHHYGPDNRDSISARVSSILELIDLVEKEEMRQVKNILTSRSRVQVLGSMYRVGLLQRKLIDVARKLIRRMYRSEFDRVRKSASIFDDQLEAARVRTEDAEKVLAEHTVGANILAPLSRERTETYRQRWGDNYRLEFSMPSELTSADPNVLSIECELGPGERAQSIIGRIQSLDHGIDEMAELSRMGNSHLFRGEFCVDWSGDVLPLPPLALSLYADSCPILKKNIGFGV